jgi:oligoendopeptidase F
MTLVRDKIKKMNEHREFKVDGNSLYLLMKDCFEIREINSKTLLYASLNYYLDINNDYYIKMKKQAEELDLFVNNETNYIDELLSIIDEDKLEEFLLDNIKIDAND